MTSKAKSINGKTNKLDLIIFFSVKDYVKRMKRQMMDLKNIVETQILTKSKTRNIKQFNQKMSKTETDISQNKTHRWLISTCKDVQYNQLSWRCKLKLHLND